MIRHQISASGAVVYWTTGASSLQKLQANLQALNLHRYTPQPRTDSSALLAAMRELAGKEDRLFQSRKNPKTNGFESLEVERGEDQNSYTFDYSAAVSSDGLVRVTRGYANLRLLQEAYEKQNLVLTSVGVSKCLVDIAQLMGGVTLRPSGGVYWLPGSSLDYWRKVVQAVESAGQNSVYTVATVVDEDTVRAVRDALQAEVTAATVELAQEATEGELGARALETRKAKAQALASKVTMYEGILGETLTSLREACSLAKQTICAASIAALGADE